MSCDIRRELGNGLVHSFHWGIPFLVAVCFLASLLATLATIELRELWVEVSSPTQALQFTSEPSEISFEPIEPSLLAPVPLKVEMDHSKVPPIYQTPNLADLSLPDFEVASDASETFVSDQFEVTPLPKVKAKIPSRKKTAASGSQSKPKLKAKPKKKKAVVGRTKMIPIQVMKRSTPRYPKLARKKGYEGRVMVELTISSTGKVIQANLKRSSGYSVLDKAALKAARKWRFKPRQVGGVSVQAKTVIPFHFGLKS